jgi:dolichol-phosphate mannosyltransferase
MELVTRATDLTIVVPTLNERENLEPLLARVMAVIGDVSWELIFVDDDSNDGTAEHARVLARRNVCAACTGLDAVVFRRPVSRAC